MTAEPQSPISQRSAPAPAPPRDLLPLPLNARLSNPLRSLLPPLLFAVSVAGMTYFRLWVNPDRVAPIGYAVPLALFLLLGSRTWMWISTAAFAVISYVKNLHVLPNSGSSAPWAHAGGVAFAYVMLDLLVI